MLDRECLLADIMAWPCAILEDQDHEKMQHEEEETEGREMAGFRGAAWRT